MNLNDFAKVISQEEGLKQSLSIAQIKEVLRITLKHLKSSSYEEIANLFKKVK